MTGRRFKTHLIQVLPLPTMVKQRASSGGFLHIRDHPITSLESLPARMVAGLGSTNKVDPQASCRT